MQSIMLLSGSDCVSLLCAHTLCVYVGVATVCSRAQLLFCGAGVVWVRIG